MGLQRTHPPLDSNFFRHENWSGWNPEGETIQMKATEQYFPVVLFIMQYNVAATFESVGEIPKCDYPNQSYWAVLSYGTVYYAAQGGSNFCVCGWNSYLWTVKWEPLSSSLLCCCLYSYFEKGWRKKCTRQSRKVLWMVLSSPFFKEIWKNCTGGHGHMFASAKGKQPK